MALGASFSTFHAIFALIQSSVCWPLSLLAVSAIISGEPDRIYVATIMFCHYSVFIYACANNVGIWLCITKLIPVVARVPVFQWETGNGSPNGTREVNTNETN